MSKSLIQRLPLFSTLSDDELEALVAGLQEVSYPAGLSLFTDGDRGDRFYVVMEGAIAILKAVGTPDERLLGIRGAGEFVGEMSLLNPDGLRTASARVHADTRVLEMSRLEFDRLLNRKPTIAYEMLRVLSARLREAHDESIRDLKEKNLRLQEAYESLRAAQEQIIEKETLERELERAREIQESMLPAVLPRPEGFEIGVRMLPARMVGGDFYDVIRLDKHRLGLVIGDVSGKGVPAALFMALTRSLLRAMARPAAQPTRVLRRVNRHLLGMNARGMFVTVLYACLDCATGQLAYGRAGHDPPLIIDASGRVTRTELKQGQILGLFSSPALELQTLALTPGSTLLLYTDGVTEAKNQDKQFLGLEGLEALLAASPGLSAQDLCDHLVEAVVAFHGASAQADDITLLAVKALD